MSQGQKINKQKQQRKPFHPLQFAVRTESGVHTRTYTPPLKVGRGGVADPGGERFPSTDIEEYNMVYNSTGSRAAIIENKQVSLYDTSTAEVKKLMSFERANVDRVLFSPGSTFLVTYEQRPLDKKENLNVWNLSTGECVLKFFQREMRKSQWPTISWSPDEALLGHLVRNEVKIYDGKNPSRPIDRLIYRGVVQFCFGPTTSPQQIAIFKQAEQQMPGCVAVFSYPNLRQVVSAKSFYQADDCVIKWSPRGDNVLINTSTETKAGFYYGEASLHLLSTSPKHQFSGTVTFGGNKGPVQCAEWSPDGRDFMVIQGYQPAIASLFLAKGLKKVRSYGQASRNTVLFSPHGRFLCIAGFGNLAGHMDFYDKNKFKLIGRAQHGDATSYQWTPDSRNFVTATTRPRRRVDERFIVWTYAGEKVSEEKVNRLCQIAIRPAPAKDTYPNRPMSARLKKVTLKSMEEKKVAKYIPPSLRARGGSKIMERKLQKMSKHVAPRVTGNPQQQKQMDKNAKRRARRARARARRAAEKKNQS